MASKSEGQQVKVCNCDKPITKGILDFEHPKYCDTIEEEERIDNVMYKLYIKDVNEWTGEGYSCMQWEKTKKVVGYFFGSYDTTFYTEPKDVTREECLKTVTQPYMCGNNRMNHDNGVYSFEQSPDGDGRWMATENIKC